MTRSSLAAVALLATAVLACAPRGTTSGGTAAPTAVGVDAAPGEPHLRNVHQLTFEGENAEAYFSPGGRLLIFQSTRDGRYCDQQYIMRTDGSHLRRVSSGDGRTTCGYFTDNGRRILYASTQAVDTACPPRPDPSRGYVWPLDPYAIYTADRDGSHTRRLTSNGVYTAEATLSPDGHTVVLTSSKAGDLELHTMTADRTNVRRLTNPP